MNENGIIELHCHTTMSEGRGLMDPRELVRFAWVCSYRALAITDHMTVQAFPAAYAEWKKLWDAYRKQCEDGGEQANIEDYLKLIYGMEGDMRGEDGKIYSVLLYVKNETGLRNLYRMITEACLKAADPKYPVISRALLDRYREGLLVVSAGVGGEIRELIRGKVSSLNETMEEDALDELKKKAAYYDFLEVTPSETHDLVYLYYGSVKLGDVPMVAGSDARYFNEKDRLSYEILISEAGKAEEDKVFHELMDDDEPYYSYFYAPAKGDPEELQGITERLFENRKLIEQQIEYIAPLREGKFRPVWPNAEEEITRICEDRVKELFGENPDPEVRARLDRELTGICKNGYAGYYLMWRKLVQKSLEAGYPVGCRGSVGSSFVAYLCGITEINPLSAACGGYDIPVETFLGFHLDKEPDIDINFAPSIRETVQEAVKELPGVGETCHAGTIGVRTRQQAEAMIKKYYDGKNRNLPDREFMENLTEDLAGTKRVNGIHPGGIMVCPEGEELASFTPLIHPEYGKAVTTAFEYHELWGSLLKLDILGHDSYELLHFLQDHTGVKIEDIPLEEKEVLSYLCDESIPEIRDIPEYGADFVRRVIAQTGARTFEDLVKISGLCHGTDVWMDNQEPLFRRGTITLKECIASRDDILLTLLSYGIGREDAYRIMELVRKGKGLKEEQAHLMTEAGLPDWYLNVCRKVRYLFPKAHAVAYAMMAVRLAYFKIHYSDAYKEGLAAIG